MTDFDDLLHKLQGFNIPVSLKVGFLDAEIGTLVPDQYWEGGEVLLSLAALLEKTASVIRKDMRDRGVTTLHAVDGSPRASRPAATTRR